MLGDVELYPHQEEARDRLGNGKILWGGTGSGKSLTAAAYYVKYEADADIYVITTAKKRDDRDWETEFAKFGIGKHSDSTVAGGTLTVDSWNNIGKYRNVVGAFFIFDEQRIVGSGEWSSVFIHITRRNRWILLTATPGDTWMDYIPVFIANGYYKNRTEFKRDHVVYNTFTKFPKVDRYIGVGKLVRLRNQLLVEMPFTRHTQRRIETIQVDYDPQLLERVVKQRWHVFEDRPLRDVAELFSVMRKVVNSDSSRVQTILTLLSVHPRLIIFYNFNYELEALKTALASVQSGDAMLSLIETETGTRRTDKSGSTDTTSTKLSSGGFSSRTEQEFLEAEKSSEGQSECLTKNESTESRRFSSLTGRSPRSSTSLSQQEFETLQANSTGSLERSSEIVSSHTSQRNSTFLESSSNPLVPSISMESGTRTKTETQSSTETESGSNPIQDLPGPSIHVAEWNGHKHQAVPTSERWVYLVQYMAGSEGWNCITTDATCFYSLPYSYKQWWQAHGRTDRLNTPFSELFYYILMSNSFIDRAIMKNLEAKRNFNESAYIRELEGKSVQKRT